MKDTNTPLTIIIGDKNSVTNVMRRGTLYQTTITKRIHPRNIVTNPVVTGRRISHMPVVLVDRSKKQCSTK